MKAQKSFVRMFDSNVRRALQIKSFYIKMFDKEICDQEMGIVKEFIRVIEKEKLVIYFMMLCAGAFFFWTVYRLAAYGFNAGSANAAFQIIANLAELGGGIMLGLFAVKLLRSDFVGSLSKEKLLPYFLLLWGISFFFWALSDFTHYGPYGIDSFENALAVLGTLFSLGVGVVLALFSWKLMSTKDTTD